MRAVWKGYLKCGLVTIPVKLYNAVKKHTIQFSLLHKECGTKIKQQRVCPTCGRVVSNEELVRGYQYGKDRWIVVTDEEIERAKKETTDALEIVKFVADDAIPPLYYSDAHYLAPDGEVAKEAFALFHRAMRETGKVALAKVVMRNREQLMALRPFDGSLLALTIHYAEEILDMREIEGLGGLEEVKVDQAALEMAKALIENLSGEFEPEQYHDEYTQTLLEIIKAKAEGQEVKVEPKAEAAKVIDLMEALKQSLMATGAEVPKKEVAVAGKRRTKTSRRAKKKA
ncbi:MAG TPA: Ku protein [Deltaproteobacteria bacterium]|nr:Ku protein [Deltaproteobacteria bacterium]